MYKMFISTGYGYYQVRGSHPQDVSVLTTYPSVLSSVWRWDFDSLNRF